MSGPELPGLLFAAGTVLLASPFLLAALFLARALLPRRARPEHRWSVTEVLAVSLTPFALFALLAALLGAQGVFVSLLLNELVLGLTGVLVLALASARPQGLATLGLAGPVPLRAFLAGPLVFLPWFFVAIGLGAAWLELCRARGWQAEQEVLLAVMELEGPRFLVAAAIAVLLGPLLEELLFRGFLQSALAGLIGERGALLATALVFTGLHGVAGLPVLLGLSLFLGWLQLRTRCLLVPWSAHVLNNAVTLAIALAGRHYAV